MALLDKKNGEWDSFKRVLFSILIIVVAGWIMWVSFSAAANKEEIAVLKASFSYVRSDLVEMKTLIKDIRQDQLRRERRER